MSKSVLLDDKIRIISQKLDTEAENNLSATAGSAEKDMSCFRDDVHELLSIIKQTKTDIADIQPKHLGTNKIPAASDQLDRVVMATEEAASKIMDSAEEIAELSETLITTGQQETSEKLITISTHIFEASSFQDITGQRVRKVVDTLRYIEGKLLHLALIVGDTDSHVEAEKKAAETGPESKENLLEGPQCPINGNDQDAIDALFDSFD